MVHRTNIIERLENLEQREVAFAEAVDTIKNVGRLCRLNSKHIRCILERLERTEKELEIDPEPDENILDVG